MRQLQSVQNAAARLITSITNRSHWYCVNLIGCQSDRQWVEFKIASLVYQVLSTKVPSYLADDIHLALESSARFLRSSSERKCSVTRVHSRFGDRSFAAAGPRIWNNLPASLWDKEVSCTEFRRQLKTFMFQSDCGTSWLFWLLRLINILTYLFTGRPNPPLCHLMCPQKLQPDDDFLQGVSKKCPKFDWL